MDHLHVATLNIRNLADRWDERLPLLLADFAALQPDLIGLQEVVYVPQQDLVIGAAGVGSTGRSAAGPAGPSTATRCSCGPATNRPTSSGSTWALTGRPFGSGLGCRPGRSCSR